MTDTPTTPPASEPEPAPGRPAWLIPAIIVAAIAAVVVIWAVVASNDDDDEAEETTTTTEAEDTTTTSEGEDTTTTSEGEDTTTTSEGEDTTTTSEGEDTTTTSEGEDTTTTEAPPEGPEAELVIGEDDPVIFVVTSCESSGETNLDLEAESQEDSEDADSIELVVEADDNEGTIVLSGREEAEGTVDELMVGDTGEFTVSGELTPSDDGAETSSYELTGSCQ